MKTSNCNGYIMIHIPSHPSANRNGYVYQHRYAMEQYLGRYLKTNEIIHHKNNIRNDNRIENLELFERQFDHFNHQNPNRINEFRDKTFRKMVRKLKA